MPIASKLYSDGYDRPALVLVHGLGSAGTIWKSLTPQLIKHFKVIAIDLPGHGVAPLHKNEQVDPKSLAQAIVEEIANTYKIYQSHVVGNSLGGWIALEMGALGPDKVKSVTALAPAGLWHSGPTKRFPPSLDARVLAKISQYFMNTAYRLPPLKALGYKKITHLWRELSFESCRDSVLAMAKSKGYKPLWNGLKNKKFESKISSEVSVSDLTLPEGIAQEKSVAPAHSDWITVENCAHVIMWNYPDLTVDLIKKTAEKVESG
jgi:pimeloyl-ACP methyl ester carboxylesterase